MSVPWERQPNGPGWRQLQVPERVRAQAVRASLWTDGKLSVMSCVEIADLPGKATGTGPQWHLSVSRFGKRPSARETARTLAIFGLRGTEEDNHHPGGARHFWLPCDKSLRGECECKESEETIVEPDGYVWQNPKPGEPCRGCEFQALMGKPCPLHPELRP